MSIWFQIKLAAFKSTLDLVETVCRVVSSELGLAEVVGKRVRTEQVSILEGGRVLRVGDGDDSESDTVDDDDTEGEQTPQGGR